MASSSDWIFKLQLLCYSTDNCRVKGDDNDKGRVMFPVKCNKEGRVIMKRVSSWKGKLFLIGVLKNKGRRVFSSIARKTWCVKIVITSSWYRLKKPTFIWIFHYIIKNLMEFRQGTLGKQLSTSKRLLWLILVLVKEQKKIHSFTFYFFRYTAGSIIPGGILTRRGR